MRSLDSLRKRIHYIKDIMKTECLPITELVICEINHEENRIVIKNDKNGKKGRIETADK